MAITINADFVAHHMTAAEICNALELRLAADAAERAEAEAAAIAAQAEADKAAAHAKAAQAAAVERAEAAAEHAGTIAALTDAVTATTWTPAPQYPVNRAGVPVAVHSKAARAYLAQVRAGV